MLNDHPSRQQLLERIESLESERNALQGTLDQCFRDLGKTFHQLRTPITNIMGFSETLLSGVGSNDPDKRNRFLGIIFDQASRMARLLSDLQLLTELEQRYLQIAPEPVPLECAAQRTAERVLRLHPHRHPDIRVQVDRMLTCFTDPFLLDRLIEILLQNAVMFTADSGKIIISGKLEENGVRLTVSDTGIGISKQDRLHVFDRFFSGDVEKRRQQGGNGLGLTIAQAIAQLHGSTITVTSNIGIGSSFSLLLPHTR